ncbi:MAG: hypothetical protein K5866_08720 [Treponema sp.]|nr:hypothetical protein [Treponema sp.]
MLKLFGDPANKAAADAVIVRDPSNFNWTFIALLAFVFYIYWSEVRNKNYKAIIAGFSLYSVHWFYEIMNAIIRHFSGYALWTVSNASSSFVLLIGVSWELSMMFSIAGIISFKMMPEDRSKRYFSSNGKKGISCKLFTTISMALLFSLFEIFLAWTPAFIWVYKWWGAIPVFITTYIPFFLASNYVPDTSPKFQKFFLTTMIGLDLLLLAILIPLGII